MLTRDSLFICIPFDNEASITNANVTCTTSTYTIGGFVSGLGRYIHN